MSACYKVWSKCASLKLSWIWLRVKGVQCPHLITLASGTTILLRQWPDWLQIKSFVRLCSLSPKLQVSITIDNNLFCRKCWQNRYVASVYSLVRSKWCRQNNVRRSQLFLLTGKPGVHPRRFFIIWLVYNLTYRWRVWNLNWQSGLRRREKLYWPDVNVC